MARTILKNKQGTPLDLDGARVIVTGSAGADISLENELAALRAKMNGLVAASDALVFKGIVNGENPLPPSGYQTGHTYKVGVAGVYAGQQCEQGDMIICVADYGDSASNTDWQVIQTNIDGAVTGPASAVAGDLAAFDNATGKVIRDSSVKTADAADAVAKRHEHANADILAGLGKDAADNLTYGGKAVGDGKIDCAVINDGEEIPANLRDNGIVFVISASK